MAPWYHPNRENPKITVRPFGSTGHMIDSREDNIMFTYSGDGQYRFVLDVPTLRYKRQMNGFCGNMDGDAKNDAKCPDGSSNMDNCHKVPGYGQENGAEKGGGRGGGEGKGPEGNMEKNGEAKNQGPNRQNEGENAGENRGNEGENKGRTTPKPMGYGSVTRGNAEEGQNPNKNPNMEQQNEGEGGRRTTKPNGYLGTTRRPGENAESNKEQNGMGEKSQNSEQKNEGENGRETTRPGGYKGTTKKPGDNSEKSNDENSESSQSEPEKSEPAGGEKSENPEQKSEGENGGRTTKQNGYMGITRKPGEMSTKGNGEMSESPNQKEGEEKSQNSQQKSEYGGSMSPSVSEGEGQGGGENKSEGEGKSKEPPNGYIGRPGRKQNDKQQGESLNEASPEEQKEQLQRVCSMLNAADGPFGQCIRQQKETAENLHRACLLDMESGVDLQAELESNGSLICHYLTSMEHACVDQIPNYQPKWRNESFCGKIKEIEIDFST